MTRTPKTLRIASVNVNGIRAAYRKDMESWLNERDVDILCLQEVRAPDKIVRELLNEENWHILHSEAADKGRAGVLIATARTPHKNSILPAAEPINTRSHIGEEYFEHSGRWVEADYTLPNGEQLTVVSAYVHSGEVDTPKQDDKYRFLERMLVRLPELAQHSENVVVVGDLNVCHTERDLKNWKANQKRAGFLPEERAYFDKFFGQSGYVDVARSLAGDVDGPYTWWSYRGQAFDNNAGWRIDYQMATPAMAQRAISSVVDRAASYDQRFSDHAPLVVDYQFA
ncbi:exodeoxyribonuclease III [Rothia sp. P13129]|uniref:exodeoxyribonuclease III n=1 Tax=unclassified Rothia (in: high G+C Gram-positive bacteria) TaxID=2689056 RepID=UPI003AC41784